VRPRGGIIAGSSPSWTSTATSGVFTLREAQEMRTANTWARGPVAPTGLTALPGNAGVSLSWTAPATAHGTITNYLVEYTASGGLTQYALTGSTSTSYNLTGLTNGTAYTVRVAAVNFTAGDYSNAVAGTPVDAPPVTLHTPFGPVTGSGTLASRWRWQSGSGFGSFYGTAKILTALVSTTLQATLTQTGGGGCDGGEFVSLGIYSSSNVRIRTMSANPESLTAGQYIAMELDCAHARAEVWIV
jgi:hypothetical protein